MRVVNELSCNDYGLKRAIKIHDPVKVVSLSSPSPKIVGPQ